MTKPWGRGAGIMWTDFVKEKGGFLALTESEYQGAKTTRPSIKPYAREFLEYGEQIHVTDGKSCHHSRNKISKIRRLAPCLGV